MRELEVLSQVVPAFGALAKEYCENGNPEHMLQDAQDCYTDILTIGHAIAASKGEWAIGLNQTDVTRLIAALALRVPRKSSIFSGLSLGQSSNEPPKAAAMLQRLEAFGRLIDTKELGGYDECGSIMTQPGKIHNQYMDVIRSSRVSLFTEVEMLSQKERKKFLKRVRTAANHLLDTYFPEDHGPSHQGLNILDHPSIGMKSFAEQVYNTLEKHWRCKCRQRMTTASSPRAVRLSLTQHRFSAPRIPAELKPTMNQLPAKFEVHLPACRDSFAWKVTTIEVKNPKRNRTILNISGERVKDDLCQYLRRSDTVQVELLIDDGKIWHLDPKLLLETNDQTSMRPLQQLLSDDHERSLLRKCNPREQLSLCYVLANSMLYIYPSPWLENGWNSHMVYFKQHPETPKLPILTSPYILAELRPHGQPKQPLDRMQVHRQPAILALGIIFLEITTGTKFERSRATMPWEQRNKDNIRAIEMLETLEKKGQRNPIKRLPTGLLQAIRACLQLKPPSTFPSDQLTETIHMRYYILACIVQPLVHELEFGYDVRLEELHKRPGSETEETSAGYIQGKSTRVTSERASKPPDLHPKKVARQPHQIQGCAAWFEQHDCALDRISSLSGPNAFATQRIRVAILDSGLDLSQQNMELYNESPEMLYKSWVDEDPNRRDEVGHGTHLAVLLRRIAPEALLHVARVYKRTPARESVLPIAKAIEYAVKEWQVNIIVLPFGFGEEQDELERWIRYASSNNVSIFAAASNDGKNRLDDIAWPARDKDVICVHSGNGYGNPSTFTPEPQDNMRIMVLGEGIESAWPSHLGCEDDHNTMSGTSCAAPIAAGIAAVILGYARGFLTPSEWTKLCRTQSLRKVFEQMQKPTHEYWWIKHWTLFDPRHTEQWIQGEIRRATF